MFPSLSVSLPSLFRRINKIFIKEKKRIKFIKSLHVQHLILTKTLSTDGDAEAQLGNLPKLIQQSLKAGLSVTALGSTGYACVPPSCPLAFPLLLHTGREGGDRPGHLVPAPSLPVPTVLSRAKYLCAYRLAGQRLAWCGTWGRRTLPRASGVVWSWTSPLGRMMGQWRAPGMVGFPLGCERGLLFAWDGYRAQGWSI